MKLIEEMRYWADFFKGTGQETAAKDFNRFADTLANSGALVPVRVDNPNRDLVYDWYMTPTGLGWWGEDKHGMPCVETPEGYHNAAHCYPVRLVPIAEWEAEG